VERSWGDAEGSPAITIWEALHGLVVSRVGTNHPTQVVITVNSNVSPSDHYDTIHFMLGRTDMNIERFRYHGAPD
jgi:hypothetical protein